METESRISYEDMKLKLAAAGDGAFEGVCRGCAEYDPPDMEVLP